MPTRAARASAIARMIQTVSTGGQINGSPREGTPSGQPSIALRFLSAKCGVSRIAFRRRSLISDLHGLPRREYENTDVTRNAGVGEGDGWNSHRFTKAHKNLNV